MGHRDVVALDGTGENGELDRVPLAHIVELAIDARWARKDVPLVQHAFVLNGITHPVFDRSLQHHEGLIGLVMVVQAWTLPGWHDGDEHGRSVRADDGRAVAKRALRVLENHRHDLAGKEDFPGILRHPGQIIGRRHRLKLIEPRNPRVHFLGRRRKYLGRHVSAPPSHSRGLSVAENPRAH